MSQRIKDFALLFLKGVAMGSADVVPGVSGGTIAFITGIYGQLLASLKAFNLIAVKLLFGFKLKQLWQHVNGTFLLVLFGGIAISVISLANIITWCLEHYPVQLWSFFFGLIIISAIMVSREIKQWNLSVVIAGLAGIAIAYSITLLGPTTTPDTWWFILLSGAIAICAMLLPGISGSFILLLLGKYIFIVSALKDFKVDVAALFIAGCAIGLITFSRVVSWLLSRYYNLTIALLSGFMIGALNKVWPWKKATEFAIDSHGKQVPIAETNLMPGHYFEQTGQDPYLLHAILLGALGIALVVVIDRVAAYTKSK